MNVSSGVEDSMDSVGSPSRDLDSVWQTLDIGPTRVRNRIMYTAQTILYGENHLLSDRHIDFYRERAKGGIGLMITEQQAGHPISKGSFYPGCTAHDKRAVPQYAKLAEAVHEFGAKQFVQLFGAGSHDKGTTVFDEWHPLWAPSRVTSVVHREVPMAMGQAEIDSTVKAFGESALNVKTSGLDGVEIHAAHSYLLGQFLSPAYNKRDDGYGGSIKNRCRIIIEIAESIRRQVDGDITVGVRLSYDEFVGDQGITGEQTDEMVQILVNTDLFDYFSITGGGYHTLHRTVSPMQVPQAFMEYAGRSVKQIVGNRAKVFLVGRILDVDVADRLIADGSTDMAAMTRAHLADPFLVKKAKEGRQEDTVRCVGANVCLAHAFDQRPSPCVMNPAMGRESRLGEGTLQTLSNDHRARKVIVVGGGPAGMRVAGTAAQRGHSVVLLERNNQLGGHINLIKQLPTRSGWQDAISNLQRPLDRFGVEVRTGVEVEPTELAAMDAEDVVCATGFRYAKSGVYSAYQPDRDHIPGAELSTVYDVATATESALVDPYTLGNSVLIYDELGDYLPLGLAEILSRNGVAVEIVTPHMSVGEDTMRTGDWHWIAPRLLQNEVLFTPQYKLDAIDSDSSTLSSVFGGPLQHRQPDSVVLTLPRIPRNELHSQLQHGSNYFNVTESPTRLHLVGDAVAPRRLEAIIYEAETMAREL